MNIDPSGCFSLFGFLFQAVVSIASIIGTFAAALVNEEVRADLDAIGWNIFNDDETAVVNAKKVSFYKGVPVFREIKEIELTDSIKIPIGGSLSFGFIVFNKEYYGKKVDMEDVVKHEYGHNIQLMCAGPIRYSLLTAIPSILKNDDNTPWELSASYLGGSPIGFTKGDIASNDDYILSIAYLRRLFFS